MNFFNNYSIIVGMTVTAVIVSGIFTYVFYNNIFSLCDAVNIINKNLNKKINSLIVVIVVVIFGVLLYTLYNNINIFAFCFTTVYCETSVSDLAWLSTLEMLQYIIGVPNNGYDITNFSVFVNMLILGKLCIAPVNGIFLNCIIINNILYTVDPKLMYFLFLMILS